MAYYAVKQGRQPGIYKDFEDAQRQVSHYSHSDYRKFKTLKEARAYLNNPKAKVIEPTGRGRIKVSEVNKRPSFPVQLLFPERDRPKNQNRVEAVVAGAFDKKEEAYAFGIIILENDTVIQKMTRMGNNPIYKHDVNLAGEALGALHAIHYAIKKKYNQVCVHHKLAGIDRWATGSWRPKSVVGKTYRKTIKRYQKYIEMDFKPVKEEEYQEHYKEAQSLAFDALRLLVNKKGK